MTAAKKNANYIPIELTSLRLDTVKSFDLYLQVKGNKYVLYLSRESALTKETLSNLEKKKAGQLYISSDAADAYQEYIEKHLSEIIEDHAVPSETKCRIVYQAATNVMRQVFDEPRAELIQRSKDVITGTVSLILSDKAAATKLMRLTSHDYYTYTHSVNVCVFCVNVVRSAFTDISEEEFRRLGVAFALHDIGKTSIPAEILSKNGPLDEDEWECMRSHPEESYRILKETGHLDVIAGLVALQHHEHIDGSGYPKGLRNGEIDEFARICAIADVFDALTTNRPHRQAMGSFEALNLMKTEMHGCFSEEHFEKFVLLLADRT